jgi:hypothetical protein
MNRFNVGSLWANSNVSADKIDMDRWMLHFLPAQFNWLIANAQRDWEYDLVLDQVEYDGQKNYLIFIVFDELDDALFYKLRWG